MRTWKWYPAVCFLCILVFPFCRHIFIFCRRSLPILHTSLTPGPSTRSSKNAPFALSTIYQFIQWPQRVVSSQLASLSSQSPTGCTVLVHIFFPWPSFCSSSPPMPSPSGTSTLRHTPVCHLLSWPHQGPCCHWEIPPPPLLGKVSCHWEIPPLPFARKGQYLQPVYHILSLCLLLIPQCLLGNFKLCFLNPCCCCCCFP